MISFNKIITGKTGKPGNPGRPGYDEKNSGLISCGVPLYSEDEPINSADNNSTNYEASIKESEQGYKHEEISVYKLGTEYLEFIINSSSKLKKQSIHINNFTNNILSGFNIDRIF